MARALLRVVASSRARTLTNLNTLHAPRIIGANFAQHNLQFCRSLSSSEGRGGDSEASGKRTRMYDATTGKPSKVCDPYENNGEPLSDSQCAQLLPTVSKHWVLDDEGSALTREIEVDNFMRGAKLLTTLAAVAFNDGHFPQLTLERRIGRGRRWQEVVVVRCQTVVLGGLSYRDFLLALLMDAELEKGA
jgi:pterin-4a-carbinolamine dehydratase